MQCCYFPAPAPWLFVFGLLWSLTVFLQYFFMLPLTVNQLFVHPISPPFILHCFHSFSLSLFGIHGNRDEREEYPVCNGPTHTGALHRDEHSRLGSHHLALLISLLLSALRDGGPYTWGPPPITLHPSQNLRGQQQCPDPERWSCQVTSVPQTFTRWG